MSGWRGLGLFWATLVVAAGAGLAVLQVLGPVDHPPPAAAHVAPAAVQEAPPTHPGVAPPDQALLEVSKAFAPAQLPRIAADGRQPSIVYAAPAAKAEGPRVALLLVGFGLSERDSRTAIQLPGPISFGVSAYAVPVPGLLDAAREAGHELFASIPMEPQGYPLNDEGTESLRASRTPEDNRRSLEWALSRTRGAVGATGASDGMRGERFSDASSGFDPVLEEVHRRGLLYVDPRPGRPARPGERSIDVVLDDSTARADLEAKLRDLERTARDHGTAIGLAGPLRPAVMERIAAWAKALPAQGITLVPVSSLVPGTTP